MPARRRTTAQRRQTNSADVTSRDRVVAGSSAAGGVEAGPAAGLRELRWFYCEKADIPAGWYVCDGTNDTPNLVGKRLKAIDDDADLGATGGAALHTPAGSVAAHTHGVGTLANTAASAGTPAGTLDSVSGGTPAGTLDSVSAGTPAGTNSTSTVTPAGTIAWPAGVPTAANESAHTHAATGLTFTGNAVAAASTNPTPDLVTSNTAGSGVSPVTTATGSIGGSTAAGSAHTHTLSWPAGVPTFAGSSSTCGAQTFTGSALAGHVHTFTGSALAGHTHTFTGDALATHNHALAGSTGSATGAFTGTEADFTDPWAGAYLCIYLGLD